MPRLLIVEDDAELQHLLGFIMYKQGYECHYAFNGKEGYEKILALHPDLVLLDLMLPIMSGPDVIKKVMEHPDLRKIPIIVITAWGGDADAVETQLRAEGVREYIRKPLVIEDLVRLVKRILSENPQGALPKGTLVEKGKVRLDMSLRTLWIDDKLVATLPPKRAELLKLLLEAKGPIKREKLLKQVWEPSAELNLLEKAIQRLREDMGEARHRIQTTEEGYELVG